MEFIKETLLAVWNQMTTDGRALFLATLSALKAGFAAAWRAFFDGVKAAFA